MNEIDQELFELEAVNAAYLKSKDRLSKGIINSAIENPLKDILVPTATKALQEAEDAALAEVVSKGSAKIGTWRKVIGAVSSDVGGEVMVNAFLSVVGSRPSMTSRAVLNAMAEAYRLQVSLESYLTGEGSVGKRAVDRYQTYLNEKSRKARYRFRQSFYKAIGDYVNEELGSVGNVGLTIASLVYDRILETHSDVFVERTRFNKPPLLEFTPEFTDDVDQFLRVAATSSPIYKPMLTPPVPWEVDEDLDRWVGGYRLLPVPLYRTGVQDHKFYPSQAAIESLNIIQNTPWSINLKALEFMRKLQHSTSDLFPRMPMDRPEVWVDAFEWEGLSEAERKNVIQENADRKAEWVSRTVKAATLVRKITLAENLVKAGNLFWQPHHFDFRGRVYPINTELTSQGDSWAKGLLQFAAGEPLGDDGLENLMIHVANTYGQDKLTLSERIQFVLDHITEWRIALLTFDGQCHLASQADEPLPFLAALWDLEAAMTSPDYRDYVSHIPCAVDGTCNGLQILSLLGLDPVGAKATNCSSDPERHDLYAEVAEQVMGILNTVAGNAEWHRQTDTYEAVEAAYAWSAAMRDNGRKIVKRAVMTTPYGVTDLGIVEQLVKDGFTNDLVIPESWDMTLMQGRHRLARHMANWIVEARASVVVEAMKLMNYFREAARVLAEHGRRMDWETPDGSYVVQSYNTIKSESIRTYDLNKRRRVQVRTGTMDVRKAMGGSAPNVVHSLDADMLRDVSRRLWVVQGIDSMAMIHDSYGVHAANVDALQALIRDSAVTMFKDNSFLEQFHELLVSNLAGEECELPELPERGSFDIEAELPMATYFFS